jgi:putative modified peptide
MTGTTLPDDQGRALLRKLATDDDFRARFEIDPASALLELGVDAADIAALSKSCCQPRPLAEKSAFADLLEQVDSAQFNAAMAMNVPRMRLD